MLRLTLLCCAAATLSALLAVAWPQGAAAPPLTNLELAVLARNHGDGAALAREAARIEVRYQPGLRGLSRHFTEWRQARILAMTASPAELSRRISRSLWFGRGAAGGDAASAAYFGPAP